MRKIGIFLGLAILVAQSNVVCAKSLEDILKEKGVITEADYKEVQKSLPVSYKPGEGVSLSTQDGKFKTTIGGMMQLRYTFMGLDDVNNTSKGQQNDSSKMEFKRVKLIVGGNAFTKDLTYNVTLNFSNITGGSTTNGGILENAYVNYKLFDELHVQAGQNKVEFGREWLAPASALEFVDQSHVTSAFTPTYDTGVRLLGKVAGGILTYSIAGTGGVGQNTFRATSNNAFSARITVNPFGEMKNSQSDVEYSTKPLLSIGSGFYHTTIKKSAAATYENNSLGFAKKNTGWFGINSGVQKFATSEDIDFNMYGFDAAFKWRGLFVTGEYLAGQADGDTSKYTLRAHGFYTQAGYFIIPKSVELAYRYSYLDPNRDVKNDHWVENTVGVSWYIYQHNLKLQADYTNIHKQSAIASTAGSKATDDNQARVQVQLLF